MSMYCRKCGKQIEEDSLYCKYCGASLSDNNPSVSEPAKKSLYGKFTNLPPIRQIALLLYCIWILGWIGYAIVCFKNECFLEDALFPFFLATIVLPFIILSGIRIYKLRKEKSMDSEENNTSSDSNIKVFNAQENYPTSVTIKSATKATIVGSEVERFSLKDFSILYGKMQVITDKATDIPLYCTFDNGIGLVTKVSYANNLKALSAYEISHNKDDLCIIEYENKVFVLSNKEE